MYKAIKEIGGYKIGEEIPTDKALVWMNMYAEPHVELVGEEASDEVEAPEEDENSSEDSSSNDVMLDDYLARGTNVVKKNVSNDDLSKDQLEKLLKLEESGKNRSKVIDAIKKKLSA